MSALHRWTPLCMRSQCLNTVLHCLTAFYVCSLLFSCTPVPHSCLAILTPKFRYPIQLLPYSWAISARTHAHSRTHTHRPQLPSPRPTHVTQTNAHSTTLTAVSTKRADMTNTPNTTNQNTAQFVRSWINGTEKRSRTSESRTLEIIFNANASFFPATYELPVIKA